MFPTALCFYEIGWSEISGGLNDVSISLLTGDFDVGNAFNISSGGPGTPFGLTGGRIIAGHTQFDNCPELTTCDITGFWQSNLVPEPMSASLLLSGLLGLALGRRYLR
jgi:hypothetical protein